MDFTKYLRETMAGDPEARLFEYRGRTYSRGEIDTLAGETIHLLDAGAVPANARIGVIVRNRVLHAAAMLGLIAYERALTTVYSIQSSEAMAKEILDTRFGAIIVDVEDWTPEVASAAGEVGAVVLLLNHADVTISAANGRARAGDGPFSTIEGERGIEILSSGTTGKPKRILFPFRMLVRAVESVGAARDGVSADADILSWPYGGIGGMCNLVAGAVTARLTVLLDKFRVPDWVEAVRRHRPKSLSGPPTVARMVLDAGVAREDLASVQYFFGGGAAFSPELQDAFETAYDLKVVWAYGATEFCGTIISWSPSLYEEFRDSKRGAVGKALPGIRLRVTDPETGAELRAGEIGYLEAIVPAVGEHWIRTTDLAMIDEDGFVFHRGRGDGAIVRGGFKVLPEKIVAALQQHPSVLDVAVVGLPDERLGEIPVAAVELRKGTPVVSVEELLSHARKTLVVHHVPARLAILEALPRTTSLKPDLGAVKRMFEAQGAAV